ncbi:hypothetical protein ACFV9C_43800 [Kribbella sp. NPDC059898]|uniref:hypothetical protein n=1 Tax=Kribbella sp. NPDC059898 TaxID=3346995 RepID=UPI0036636D87
MPARTRLERFLAGADRRGEVAMVISIIGDAEDTEPRSVMANYDASIELPLNYNRVTGRRLPSGTKPRLAEDLDPADRDLALRLTNRPIDAPWWSLELQGTTLNRVDGRGPEVHHPVGTFKPLLVDGLDNPIAAVWIEPSQSQRWYIVPDTTDVNLLLSWLINQGLPAYVPEVLRRVRSAHFIDPDLQTAAELAARRQLDDFEAGYAAENARLQLELRQAEVAAESIRYGLLYGSGSTLVTAVKAALTAAGLAVVDLDDELTGTRSADLLVLADGHRILTEVKGVGGAAPENLVGDLKRHLETWPPLRPSQPITQGLLIVNHQHKLSPADRAPQVYSRPEFVQALDVRVLSALELFEHWRTENWPALRDAVIGDPQPVATSAEADRRPRRSWWGGRLS